MHVIKFLGAHVIVASSQVAMLKNAEDVMKHKKATKTKIHRHPNTSPVLLLMNLWIQLKITVHITAVTFDRRHRDNRRIANFCLEW
jgi:hypothetical protein